MRKRTTPRSQNPPNSGKVFLQTTPLAPRPPTPPSQPTLLSRSRQQIFNAGFYCRDSPRPSYQRWTKVASEQKSVLLLLLLPLLVWRRWVNRSHENKFYNPAPREEEDPGVRSEYHLHGMGQNLAEIAQQKTFFPWKKNVLIQIYCTNTAPKGL